jgi:Arc/MetJ-type ribon-helix-helix transcriptional regulator
MSIQIAVRLPESLVRYLDPAVAEGRASSRADVVAHALMRERRRETAERDLAILLRQPDRDLDALASFVNSTAAFRAEQSTALD